MEEIILLLYLREEEYGKRLLRFLTGKRNPGVFPELVTKRSRKSEWERRRKDSYFNRYFGDERGREKTSYLSV